MNRTCLTRQNKVSRITHLGRCCAALLLLVSTGVAMAGNTPYHQTFLSGPASDPDGSYDLVWAAIPLTGIANNDTVLQAVLHTV